MNTVLQAPIELQPADEPARREAQRVRLSSLRDELIAEDVNASKLLAELGARADKWPE